MSNVICPLDVADYIMKLAKEGKPRAGFSTGFYSIDPLMKLAPGYLSIVSGIPGMGKSEFVDAIAINTAVLHGWKWIYFSPENFPVAEHVSKIAEKYVGRRIDKIGKVDIGAALEWMQDHFSWITPEDDDVGFKNILSIAQSVVNVKQCTGMVIDPWNEVGHDMAGMRDDQYLAKALRELRQFTRKNKLHTIVVAHPNKTEKKDGAWVPPTLYDLNGGAMWRNKADYGFVVHRPSMDKNEMVVYVQKVKFKWMGQIGFAGLDYDYGSGRFKDQDNPDFTLPEPHEEVPFL